jgi:hypothetical protein
MVSSERLERAFHMADAVATSGHQKFISGTAHNGGTPHLSGSTTIENRMQKSKSVHDRSGPTMKKKWRGFVDGTSRCIVDG